MWFQLQLEGGRRRWQLVCLWRQLHADTSNKHRRVALRVWKALSVDGQTGPMELEVVEQANSTSSLLDRANINNMHACHAN